MCQWALMALVDLPRVFEYLAYLGYNIYENESQLTAITGNLSAKQKILVTLNGLQYFSNTRKETGLGKEAIKSKCVSMSRDRTVRFGKINVLSKFY